MTFDFDAETRRALGYRLIDWIDEYFSSLPGRPVQLPLEERSFAPLTGRLPEVAEDAASVLDDACRELIDKGFHVPAANYFGLMNPTPAYMAVLAEALVAALNPQLASLARSQLASRIEAETVRWLGERVGWEGDFSGTFTSGGNEANFSALAVALAWHFPEVVENGVASLSAPPVCYASAEAHHSLDKSVGLLGLGRHALRRIPIDGRIQLDLDRLEQAIQRDFSAGYRPFAIVATAGTTSAGAIDDLSGLAAMARRYHLWLHVDAAYGGAMIFSNRHRELLRGLELSDSVTIDPHKGLAMPFAAGALLTTHPNMLEQTFAVATPYMPRARSSPLPDNFQISAQWSRRMNSLKLWLTLRVHGRQAYEELLDRQMRLAQSFAGWITESGRFELAAPQVLPIVTFRLRANGHSEDEVSTAHTRLLERVTAGGQRWISGTHVAGRSVLRMMIISYLTEERHLQALEEALLEAAGKIE
jgi:glutamate/tyrosine decarboxylase-like PLP-dependent enzyme